MRPNQDWTWTRVDLFRHDESGQAPVDLTSLLLPSARFKLGGVSTNPERDET